MSGQTTLSRSTSTAAHSSAGRSAIASRCPRLPAQIRNRLRVYTHQVEGDTEDGFGAVDLMVVTTIVVSLLLLAVGLGRVRSADQMVGSAAADGARAASLQRTAVGAQQAAEQTIAASLVTSETSCAGGPAVSVDVSRWRPGGSVSVTVACTAALADLTAPGLPGSKTLTAHATSPIDSRRSAAA